MRSPLPLLAVILGLVLGQCVKSSISDPVFWQNDSCAELYAVKDSGWPIEAKQAAAKVFIEKCAVKDNK